MAVNVGTLEALLKLRDEMSSGLAIANRNLQSFARNNQKSFKAIGQAGALAATGISAIVGAYAAVSAAAIKAAMDAVESENLFEVSFKDMSAQARAWSKEVSAAVGTNEFALRKNAATLFTMTSAMGVNKDAAFELSTRLTELAGDLSSFRDIPIDVAFAKLRSGLVGESEPLKQIGILVDENTVKQQAYASGIAKAGSELTQQQKILARYQAILRQTSDAQGDLARTGDSPTNMLRMMGERVDQLKIQLGMGLMPVFREVLKVMFDGLKSVEGNLPAIIEGFKSFTVFLLDTGTAGVEVAKIISNAWLGLEAVIRTVLGGISKFASATLSLIAFAPEGLAELGLLPDSFKESFSGLKETVAQLDQAGKEFGSFGDNVDRAMGKSAAMTTVLDAGSGVLAKLKTAVQSADTSQIAAAASAFDFGGALDDLGSGADDATKKIKKLQGELDDWIESVSAGADELEGVDWDKINRQAFGGIALRELDKVIDPAKGLWTRYSDVVEQELENATATVEQHVEGSGGLLDSLLDSLSNLPGVILGAIQGGGDVGKSIGASLGGGLGSKIGKDLAENIGGFLGKSLGSVIPGLGSLVGGGLGSLIGGLFGPSEHEKVNDIRDAFLETFGGWEKLAQSLAAAGDSGLMQRVFDAKTVKDLEQAVGKVNALLGRQAEAQESVRDAAERYGFTLAELPQHLKQEEFDKLFGGLLKDYELLIAAGFDANTVIARMGPALNEAVQSAMSTGTALPEAFRPIVEQLIASGQLLDANGNAFQNLEATGLTFTQSLTEGMQSVVEEIRNLVAALTGIPAVRIPVEVDTGGFDPGRFQPSRLEHFSSAGGFGSILGPKKLNQDTVFQAHKGEHVLVAPKKFKIKAVSAAGGFGGFGPIENDPQTEPGSGGTGGGSEETGSGSGTTGGNTQSGGGTQQQRQTQQKVEEVSRHVERVLEVVQAQTQAIEKLAESQKPSVQVVSTPQINIDESPLGTQKSREDLRAFTAGEFKRVLRQRDAETVELLNRAIG